jgi:hypothetical protein
MAQRRRSGERTERPVDAEVALEGDGRSAVLHRHRERGLQRRQPCEGHLPHMQSHRTFGSHIKRTNDASMLRAGAERPVRHGRCGTRVLQTFWHGRRIAAAVARTCRCSASQRRMPYE